MPDRPIYEVKFTSLVYGGDAFGRLPDGRAVFAPFILPGETARIEAVDERRGHVRGRLVEILEASPQRIQPACPHFGVCGGCHYQHLPYPYQLAQKEAILREQLSRLGGFAEPPVLPIIPSPNPFHYRNTVQFHLSSNGRLGYQAAQTNQVVEIQACSLPETALDQVWPQLSFEPDCGLERISLRLGLDDEVLLTLEGSAEALPEIQVEGGLSVVHLEEDQAVVLAGEDFLLMKALDQTFQVSAGSFFQVNTPQAEAMLRFVLDQAPLSKDDTLVELFCGVGLFSLFLAPHVGRLIGIERSPSACEDFAANLDAYDHVELYQGAVEDVLPALNVHPRVVLADPPRSGFEPRALDALLASAPQTIVYVSCDPATLARDAKKLAAGGYRIRQVQPFDLFPQTYHIETILVMAKDG